MGRPKKKKELLEFKSEELKSGKVRWKLPQKGSVIEVRYLYAFRESGSVYQPVYIGRRDDMGTADCVVDQLKYKTA